MFSFFEQVLRPGPKTSSGVILHPSAVRWSGGPPVVLISFPVGLRLTLAAAQLAAQLPSAVPSLAVVVADSSAPLRSRAASLPAPSSRSLELIVRKPQQCCAAGLPYAARGWCCDVLWVSPMRHPAPTARHPARRCVGEVSSWPKGFT